MNMYIYRYLNIYIYILSNCTQYAKRQCCYDTTESNYQRFFFRTNCHRCKKIMKDLGTRDVHCLTYNIFKWKKFSKMILNSVVYLFILYQHTSLDNVHLKLFFNLQKKRKPMQFSIARHIK